ncbi:MAG: hypothetical protein Q8Q85_11725 [Gemmatimonadales bacterium]|nr:hypothetical protein [Gemmatimonadales bacterium]
MRGWRLPLLLSAAVLLAQLARRSPLIDVVSGASPADVHLAYPVWHFVFAPFTLLADWLNGGGTADLKGFGAWAVVAYVVARLVAIAPPRERPKERSLPREALGAVVFAACVAAFIAWVAYLPRPIPRLVADDPDLLVFDLHSHTSTSHDGRRGFVAAANAAWHARAGFDAAFVTDHNRHEAQTRRRTDAQRETARLLDGEELSLHGLHLIVLGNRREIDNRGFNQSWDSTGALIRRLAFDSSPPSSLQPPFLIASLPEYWRKHWGADLGDLARWGVGGFEIWTTSPRAMEFPPDARRAMVVQARLHYVTLFGATDMHGLGNTASVWNVARVPGWRAMSDSALTAVLLATFRARGADANQVIALSRWMPSSRLGQAVAVPVNAALVLASASLPHAVALVGWIWLVVLLLKRKKR